LFLIDNSSCWWRTLDSISLLRIFCKEWISISFLVQFRWSVLKLEVLVIVPPVYMKQGCHCFLKQDFVSDEQVQQTISISLCYGPTLPTPRCCWCLEFQWKCQKLSAKTCKISHQTLYFLKFTFSPNTILWNMFACMIRMLSLMHQSQGHVHCEKY
jgi:hypothetical protein